MWWPFCFKSPKTADLYEDEIARYKFLEDELLAKDIQESLNQQDDSSPCRGGQQEKEEETRGTTRELESPLEYDEDKQLDEAVKQSLKEEGQRKQREDDEQVKNDEKIAKVLQNMVESPPRIDKRKNIPRRASSDVVDEQLDKAIEESLKEEVKRKQLEEQAKKDEQIAKEHQNFFSKTAYEESSELHDNPVSREQLNKAVEESLKEEVKRKQLEEQVKKDEQIAKDLHNNSVSSEQFGKIGEKSFEDKGKRKQFEDEQLKKDEQIAKNLQNFLSKIAIEERTRLHDESVLDEEDEQLAEAVEKSLMEKGKGKESKDVVEEDEKFPEMIPPPSMCGGCNSEIEPGRSVNVLGVLWHHECLRCDACHKLISIHKVKNHVSNSRGKFHKSCYGRFCYICKEKKMRSYNEHHFWKERYCCSHESDGTPKCCSCERLEPWGTSYVILGDGRRLCLECMESAVMDSHECQPLHFEIREYFEGLHMKIEKEFPFLLVEKQALNKAEKEEKLDNEYEVVTRGICLSEAQTVMSVSKATRTGSNIDTDKEPLSVFRECEVTAILILYGLPRLLTGYILAHEMMHAYLRLNGHRKLNKVMEEGICQVLGHMWLESQTYATTDAEASSSSSLAPATTASASSKKGEWSDFEKKLVGFCKNQIETDESRVYGDGFRIVNKMVTNSSLQGAIKEILRRG